MVAFDLFGSSTERRCHLGLVEREVLTGQLASEHPLDAVRDVKVGALQGRHLGRAGERAVGVCEAIGRAENDAVHGRLLWRG